MEVKRICQWCGKPFIAQKTTTNYCSPQCSKRGYKHRMKERRMELIQSQELLEVKKMLENQEYFTFSQAAKLMGVSRQYIYKLVKEDKLRASRISSRMSFIRRADIELLLKSKPYERVMSKVEFDIAEYYTAEEIAQKYKVNTKWVWTYTREYNVPKVKIRQFNYYSKKHGMSPVAIRSHVYRNNIPSKKEHGQIFYSKLHFDLSKQTAEDNASEYYTVQEVMKKYNLTRDSVYGILQFHEIKREKKGRFVRFLKVEFDHVMGVRK